MKTHLFVTPSTALRTSFSLLTVFLISACASTATQTSVPQPAVVEPSATALSVEQLPVDLTATPLFTATTPVEVQPAATSRGPELHATDPTTVSLASGQIQFVEFFRFT
ncbi:MAG: hypothetical protein ABIQ77_01545 [Anaerolineales bacterium]